MSKLYMCAKGCGSIEETNRKTAPVCCGVEMVEIKEEDIFGCGGCCACCGGCGVAEEKPKAKAKPKAKKVAKAKTPAKTKAKTKTAAKAKKK